MTNLRKENRLKWAITYYVLDEHVGRELCSRMKKIILDGPDDMQHYWRDIHNKPEVFVGVFKDGKV